MGFVVFVSSWLIFGTGGKAEICVRQLMEQAPGPRGSPHAPQGDAAAVLSGDEAPFATANTDSCFSSSALAQAGQLGDSRSRVRYSKWWPQARQAYSNNGMTSIVQPAFSDVQRPGRPGAFPIGRCRRSR
jgi:hypothetical protein